jgi:AAA domain, putative AbiEii toxin, Type IV TA system
MHIKKVHIQNIRSIKELAWSLPKAKPGAGWHVILGEDGSGKSTFLRSIALAMIGPLDAAGLRLSWDDWLRKGGDAGRIAVTIRRNREIDKYSRRGKTPTARLLSFGVYFKDVSRPDRPLIKIGALRSPIDTGRHVWGDGMGWFCAGYGPIRRFAGVDAESERLFSNAPKLARFLSLFDERAALTNGLEWLQTLQVRQLEMQTKSKRWPRIDFLSRVIHFINQPGFLPSQAQLTEVTPQQVVFRDSSQEPIPIETLTAESGSIFGMTLELIRQLSIAYGPDSVFDKGDPTKVACEGVVLIDDLDADLHPTWQRRVGPWFREHFPNIQFLVSTHNPIICQAADVGSVFVLPRPGLDEPGRMVEGEQLQRLVHGNGQDGGSPGDAGDQPATSHS